MRKLIRFILPVFFAGFITALHGQPSNGTLFIIGGGTRPPEMVTALVNAAELRSDDHISILPMSSAEPDTAFYYIKVQLEKLCRNTIANLNFTNKNLNNKEWIDSVRNAQLIFITGGDQNRFMKLVLKTSLHKAILEAYTNGAVVAGTSAGAAVMSKHMITGNETSVDSGATSSFRKIVRNNAEVSEGLGLIQSVIIDQHFIVRSRYNRLLTVLQKFPDHMCIGIDEATAVIIKSNKASVLGKSQVLCLSEPIRLAATASGLVKFDDVKMSLYTDGDTFLLPRVFERSTTPGRQRAQE